jgi:putative CocE/NonD family hydrolase
MRATPFLCAVLLMLGLAAESRAEPFDIKAHYDKAEYRIPMRDGVKLFVAVYTPKDTSQRYPILMTRTPYSIKPYGTQNFHDWKPLAPAESFLREGYIFVLQDVRGRYKSEGEWEDFRPLRTNRRATDETTDTYDTIEWLIHHVAGNSGRVGLWGISYAGWYTMMGILEPHPALKAASPQATTGDPFIGDDLHWNGALDLMGMTWVHDMYRSAQLARGEQAETAEASPDPYSTFGEPWAYRAYLPVVPTVQLDAPHFGGEHGPLWANIVSHPDYDEFWRKHNMLEPLKNIRLPVLNVSGWFDTFDLYGQMETYKAIERQVPHNASTLVAGPWRHGGWRKDDGTHLGDIQFGSKTSEYFQQDIILPFFQRYLKGKGDWSAPEAVVFETGGNVWHRFDQWPPANVTKKNLYFRAGGALSYEAPTEDSASASDEYPSDPAKPVPHSLKITGNPDDNWRIEDQRLYSTRPDVLTYETPLLDQDVTIAGPVHVSLFASTSGTDSDWVVKLIDIYPDDAPEGKTAAGEIGMAGYQMLVGVDLMRGRYRRSFAHPEPMTPGEPTPIAFDILDRCHTFRKGHRIGVQVQSSFFPFVDRNPQTFVDIYHARPEDYRKAVQRISRSVALPSHLELPVLGAR